jgi:ATP-binding cassette, subfamily C (CFTR/MRP), member 1
MLCALVMHVCVNTLQQQTLAGVLVVIIAVLPWFAIAVVPLLLIYYKIQKYYRPVSRDLQRLDCLSRSPIFAHFSETLNGVSTL